MRMNFVLGGALSAVRAQCNRLAVWPYSKPLLRENRGIVQICVRTCVPFDVLRLFAGNGGGGGPLGEAPGPLSRFLRRYTRCTNTTAGTPPPAPPPPPQARRRQGRHLRSPASPRSRHSPTGNKSGLRGHNARWLAVADGAPNDSQRQRQGTPLTQGHARITMVGMTRCYEKTPIPITKYYTGLATAGPLTLRLVHDPARSDEGAAPPIKPSHRRRVPPQQRTHRAEPWDGRQCVSGRQGGPKRSPKGGQQNNIQPCPRHTA